LSAAGAGAISSAGVAIGAGSAGVRGSCTERTVKVPSVAGASELEELEADGPLFPLRVLLFALPLLPF
jgi:hypothetical protein